jgi:hypothetical protein
MNFIKKLPHYGDILAIPFFILLSIYFYHIENKNTVEYVLLLFALGGLVADMIFTLLFFT